MILTVSQRPHILRVSSDEFKGYAMVSTKPLMKGKYAEIVRAQALALLDRVGDFTVNKLCHETGLKPTRNLRRRLAELVYSNDLGYTLGYSEQGHMVGYFMKPVVTKEPKQTELPF